MKTTFNDFIKEDFQPMKDNPKYREYFNGLTITKQAELLKRGDKIIIKSEDNDVFLNIPLKFIKLSNNTLYVYDDDDSIYRINLKSNNDYCIEFN